MRFYLSLATGLLSSVGGCAECVYHPAIIAAAAVPAISAASGWLDMAPLLGCSLCFSECCTVFSNSLANACFLQDCQPHSWQPPYQIRMIISAKLIPVPKGPSLYASLQFGSVPYHKLASAPSWSKASRTVTVSVMPGVLEPYQLEAWGRVHLFATRSCQAGG